MNSLRISSLLLLIAMFAGCGGGNSYLPHLGESESPKDRRLLVTFVDRTINRNQLGNSQDPYHIHSAYNNSGWSERIAKLLAIRYSLQLVAQWPVSELGVSCVVYEVPEALPIIDTIATLQKDSDVTSVQPMQRFEVLAIPTTDSPTVNNNPYLLLQKAFSTRNILDWQSFPAY